MSTTEKPSPEIETEKSNGPVYIRSDRNFKYPPTMRARPGSRLRIKPDGSVSYHNPDCMKDARPGSRPFKLPALNGRIDKDGETFERMKAAVDKRASKDRARNFERFTGRPAIDGFYIASTDGRTALLKRGPGTGERFDGFDEDVKAARLVSSITDPEFHLALKRAQLMTEEKSRSVRFIASPGELKLTSFLADVGEFEESLPVTSEESWHITLDPTFLEPMCGSWPVFVWYSGPERPVMFESASGDWRYIVAAQKDKFKPEPAAEPIPAAELPGETDPAEPEPAGQGTEPAGEPAETSNGPVYSDSDVIPAHISRSDTCPICGEFIQLRFSKTTDGRLIGTCGDAFTQAQWDGDVPEPAPAGQEEEPENLNGPVYENPSPDPEPVPTGPAELAGQEEEPEPGPAMPLGELETKYTRLVIAEAMTGDAAETLCNEMKFHVLGIAGLLRSSVLLEQGGNMAIMTLEFRTLAEAAGYSGGRWYRDFTGKTNHLLLGSYVHKIFRNMERAQ